MSRDGQRQGRGAAEQSRASTEAGQITGRDDNIIAEQSRSRRKREISTTSSALPHGAAQILGRTYILTDHEEEGKEKKSNI